MCGSILKLYEKPNDVNSAKWCWFSSFFSNLIFQTFRNGRVSYRSQIGPTKNIFSDCYNSFFRSLLRENDKQESIWSVRVWEFSNLLGVVNQLHHAQGGRGGSVLAWRVLEEGEVLLDVTQKSARSSIPIRGKKFCGSIRTSKRSA